MFYDKIKELDEVVLEVRGIRDLLGIIYGYAFDENQTSRGSSLESYDYGFLLMYNNVSKIVDRMDNIVDDLIKILKISRKEL